MTAPGFYPDDHFLPAGYAQRHSQVLLEQLAAAGLRLAALLNQSLGATSGR
jgi:hypothetical protein